MHAFEFEALRADFPFARSLIVVRSESMFKKTGVSSIESRYYLSSREAGQHTQREWLELIRGHWAGVEVRNHWRRDAIQGEDGSRSRHPTLLANLALIRNTLLRVLAEALEEHSLPALHERLHSHPNRCLAFLARS